MSAKHEADLKLGARLLLELYDNRSNYYLMVSITNCGLRISFGRFFLGKTSVTLFINVENCAKNCEESH